MAFVRTKTIYKEHQKFEKITTEWSITKRQTELSLYVLRFGIIHMLLLEHREKAIHRLGDILFSGAFLDGVIRYEMMIFHHCFGFGDLGLKKPKNIQSRLQNLQIEESVFLLLYDKLLTRYRCFWKRTWR